MNTCLATRRPASLISRTPVHKCFHLSRGPAIALPHHSPADNADAISTPLNLRIESPRSSGVVASVPTSSGLGMGSMTEIYGALSKALDIYLLILTVRVLLSWFQNINWYSEPFATLRAFTDPFLNLFRGIIPAVGGIDLSPMLGFFLLNFVAKQLRIMAMGL
mmetsp:Transcript_35985/g.80091  ORF Transcript_35985/g.80091 Transcript_35985/m.80091 type:complete len:163 (+) Transcript_35985:54-542(+)|eukprot:CAMPEP_0202899580 /NCGR_PEP_ID=MMETSP1392-20130828/7770_1 /ASSEMBLY_ACC=CAM_ASM_000868 /TAXON_ID=225041 /ORGANISM="Chlamydomonas chlamydogama, Strain SAG 11-48b" /LENGTH=162 /DNA_ID=CAMNT_0049585793 /DNA_START=65 /DNA_END=553 /DNA_ORIENTATION=+